MERILNIRPTTTGDVGTLMEIFERARLFMAQTGNPLQWINGYPERWRIENDISRGESYVVEFNGRVVGTFCFTTEPDPTYTCIDGAWLNDAPYGTIHRIASAGVVPGIASAALHYCLTWVSNIRIDTHEDNLPMRRWILGAGFKPCGVILTHNGTPRLAFQLANED